MIKSKRLILKCRLNTINVKLKNRVNSSKKKVSRNNALDCSDKIDVPPHTRQKKISLDRKKSTLAKKTIHQD